MIVQVSKKLVVVGELNPFGADPRMALFFLPRTSSGNRLRLIMGLSDVDYVEACERRNLCAGKWSMPAAKGMAQQLLSTCSPPVFLLLGAKVRAAFRGPDAFCSRPVCDKVLVSIPHPSGRCRAWNEEGAVRRARQLLVESVPGVAWGSASTGDRTQFGG